MEELLSVPRLAREAAVMLLKLGVLSPTWHVNATAVEARVWETLRSPTPEPTQQSDAPAEPSGDNPDVPA
jgi:hypothetical protein